MDRSEEARQAAIDKEQVKKDAAAQKRRDKAAALDSEEEFVDPPEELVTQNGDTESGSSTPITQPVPTPPPEGGGSTQNQPTSAPPPEGGRGQAIMTEDFETANGTDDGDINSKLASVKLTFDETGNVIFFFTQLEMRLEHAGVRSQWLKRIGLHNTLPNHVQEEVMEILSKPKSKAGDQPYLKLKTRLLELYGPKETEVYDRAAALTLTGKPSQLAVKIIGLLCENEPPLTGCCCHKTVSGLWRKQLPPAVKAAVASSKLTASDLEQTLRIADDVFNATQQSHPGLPVAAMTSPATDLDTTQPALQHDVAAVRARAAGQASRMNKPQGQRSGQNTASSKQKNKRAPRHPDNPPEECCRLHWKFGKGAYQCLSANTCPWQHIISPKPK